MSRQSTSRSRLVCPATPMCSVETTVACTKNRSAPASAIARPKRRAAAGVALTAAIPPPERISWIRSRISSSRTGCA